MTLKMASPQVVETSVNVNNNSSFQNYANPDDHTQQTNNNSNYNLGIYSARFVLNNGRMHVTIIRV